MMDAGGATNVVGIIPTNKKYKGILHKDSLRWCHGSLGIEHDKVRKFRYPFYKYVQIQEYKIILCVCKNCNMLFWGDDAKGIPLTIPVRKDPVSYIYWHIPVIVNGEFMPIINPAKRSTNLGWATQEMINEDTRRFIEHVQ